MADPLIKIWSEGFRGDVAAEALGVLPKYEFKLGTARALTDFEPQFTFFTPAALYVYASFVDAPLIDFAHRHPTVRIWHHYFSRPLFAGLTLADGDPDWNHAIWVIESRHWPAFLDFMCSLNLVDTPKGQLYGVGYQCLPVLDPIAGLRLIASDRLPVIWVGLFGINGSRARAAFVPSRNLLTDVPRLCFYPPGKDMAVYAAALLRGDNPHLVRDKFLRESLVER